MAFTNRAMLNTRTIWVMTRFIILPNDDPLMGSTNSFLRLPQDCHCRKHGCSVIMILLPLVSLMITDCTDPMTSKLSWHEHELCGPNNMRAYPLPDLSPTDRSDRALKYLRFRLVVQQSRCRSNQPADPLPPAKLDVLISELPSSVLTALFYFHFNRGTWGLP